MKNIENKISLLHINSLRTRPCIYVDIYTDIWIRTWRHIIGCFDECPSHNICTPTFVLTSFEYVHACILLTERSEACSERSDECPDCKLHITMTKHCTQHRPTTAHDTDKQQQTYSMHSSSAQKTTNTHKQRTVHNKRLQSWCASSGREVLSLSLNH